MRVTVLGFAAAREAMGADRLDLELREGASVGEALDSLVKRYPKLAPMRGRLAAAVAMEYVRETHVLCDGDELVLIPPVSGG